MSWTIIVIIICLVLLAFALWLEFRRENHLRLIWRVIAIVVAVAALACIALPVSYHTKTLAGNKEAILLTPGFDADSLKAYPGTKLFSTESSVLKANPKLKITLVTDLADFENGKYPVSGLHLLGYGLDTDQLTELKKIPIQFHPAAVPVGITAIAWDKVVKAGEPLTIQGKFENSGDKKVTIILKGLSTGLDSLSLPAKATQSFSLSFVPKNIGKASYSLVALAGKDTLEKEAIPFEVEPAQALKILMLASAPDFENRFLKDWLAKNGYGLAIRTAISKAKYSREYFNMPQIGIDQITPGLLGKFDLVIGDLSAFKTLSATETAILKEQISGKGLGVIVKADSSKGISFLSGTFPTQKLVVVDQHQAPVYIDGKSTPSAKLPLDNAAIVYQNNTQPLVSDEQKHVLISSTIYGGGKIVYNLLSSTYNWGLSGSQDDYTALWSLLIGKAAKKITTTQKWSTEPNFPKVNEPAHLVLEGPVTIPAKVYAGNSLLAFAQNPAIPFKWDAAYWPKTNGWQQVEQSNTPAYSWYVYESDSWNTLLATQKISATQKYLAKNSSKSPSATEKADVEVPVSKLYFYILLLLACAYLWVERKL